VKMAMSTVYTSLLLCRAVSGLSFIYFYSFISKAWVFARTAVHPLYSFAQFSFLFSKVGGRRGLYQACSARGSDLRREAVSMYNEGHEFMVLKSISEGYNESPLTSLFINAIIKREVRGDSL